ncbi:DEAD/DEAH box helicase [uncultured Sphaerochaeta sp.]|uniref:DEAD/DEAH box helicase n=1 Tax=uncultured Sphaerochaeta sp. TaxID=886478 RepID=UPI00261B7227|nr:DEAD/DEAH box helicase [uncultured Sphaerochaeta sp.]
MKHTHYINFKWDEGKYIAKLMPNNLAIDVVQLGSNAEFPKAQMMYAPGAYGFKAIMADDRIKYFEASSDDLAMRLYQDLHSCDWCEFELSFVVNVTAYIASIEERGKISVDIKIPANSSGYMLRDYQMAGVQHITSLWKYSIDSGERKMPILLDEQGLGKTAQGLCSIAYDKDILYSLIVCPASLRGDSNWYGEARIWLNIDDTRFMEPGLLGSFGRNVRPGSIQVVTSGTQKIYGITPDLVKRNREAEFPRAYIVIVSYEGLKSKKIWDQVSSIEWDCVIGDEMQKVKNTTTANAKKFFGLKCKRSLLMTGTPADYLREVWGALNFSWPSKFKSRGAFMHQYEDNPNGAKLLSRDWAPICLSRSKHQVARELPPKIRNIIELPVDPSFNGILSRHAAIMDEHFDGGMNRIEELAREAREFHIASQRRLEEARRISDEEEARVSMEISREGVERFAEIESVGSVPITEMSRMRRELGEAKVEAAISFIKELASSMPKEEKILIFYHHKEVGNAIESALKSCVRISGDTTNRSDLVSKFRNDPSIKYFLGSTRATNMGLNLQVSSTVVIVEPDFSWGIGSQSEDRAHRIGQKNVVNTYLLVLSGTLDHRIIEINFDKANTHYDLVER